MPQTFAAPGPRLRLARDLRRARTCVLNGLAGMVASRTFTPPVLSKEIPHTDFEVGKEVPAELALISWEGSLGGETEWDNE